MIKQTFLPALFALAATATSATTAAPTFTLPEGTALVPGSVLKWGDEEPQLDYWVHAYINNGTEDERERFSDSGDLGNTFSYRLPTEAIDTAAGADITVKLWYGVSGQSWQFVERDYRVLGEDDCPAAVRDVYDDLIGNSDLVPDDQEPGDYGGCSITFKGYVDPITISLFGGGFFGADTGYFASAFLAPGGNLLLSDEELLACEIAVC